MLGFVSSIIAIFDSAHDVYTAAHDTKGLPKVFQATADQILLVTHTLHLVKPLNERTIGKDAMTNVEPVLKRCEDSAKKVKEVFDKVLPSKDTSKMERYRRSMEIRRRSGEVKENMKLVMEGLASLAQYQIFQDAHAIDDLKTAIDELAMTAEEEENAISVHHGSGDINNYHNSGTQEIFNHSGSGNQAKIMNIGKN